MKVDFRPFIPGDYASVARHANNIKIWNSTRDRLPYPYTEEHARAFIAYATGKCPVDDFAITVDGQAVGAIGIVRRTDVERISAEIGYWLGEEYWGKGITSAIVGRFTGFIFETTNIKHLYAGIFDFNKASMRVLEKNGFTLAGIMHRCAIKNGNVIDMHYYEKLKHL